MTVAHIVRRSAASTGAVNVAVAVDLPIDSTASTPITSPGGEIIEMAVDVVNTAQQIADAGVVWSIRLSGAGLRDGPQDFTCGAHKDGTTSTDAQVSQGQNRIILDPPLGLKVNQPIVIQVFWNGVDIGTPMAQVELVIVSPQA